MKYAFPTAILNRMIDLDIRDRDALHFAGITWDPADCMPSHRQQMEILSAMVDREGVWLKRPPKGNSRAALCWRAMDAALNGCLLPEWRPEAGAGIYRNPSKYSNRVCSDQRTMLFGIKLAIFARVIQKKYAHMLCDEVFSEPLNA